MASPKNRDYFITVNQSAESYEKALDIVKELNYNLYAYIIHDKDTIITDQGEVKTKKIHKHIVIELKNPISFSSIQNKFKGAHIEVIKYKKSAYQYLLHESPNSKGEKYQYPITDIITNNLESVKQAIQNETCELFYETRFLEYIADGVITPYQFVKRFGMNAYKQYWKPYLDMLSELPNDSEMQNDLNAIKQVREQEQNTTIDNFIDYIENEQQ